MDLYLSSVHSAVWQVLGGVHWRWSDDRTSNRHTGAVHCASEMHFTVSSGLTWHNALSLALPATPPVLTAGNSCVTVHTAGCWLLLWRDTQLDLCVWLSGVHEWW